MAKADLSLSAVDKFRTGRRVPSDDTAARIELICGRIWSAPSVFRRRQLEAKAQSLILSEVEKGVSEADARAIVATKYPALASSINPTP